MESPASLQLAMLFSESRMKILLNGLPVRYPISGVGRYTLQLGSALESLLGSERLLWFGKKYENENSDNERSTSWSFFQHKFKNNLRKIPGLKTFLHIWRDNQFRSYVQNIKPSLYHETNYAPFQFKDGPTVITIYDLSFIRHPEWHPAERVDYLEKYCVKKLRAVDGIITISEFSKKEIVDLLSVDPTKIFVTYLGVGQNFAPGAARMGGLPDHYILFLGNLEPRKNLPVLLEAFDDLPKEFQRRYPLVVAGAYGWHLHELRKALRRIRARDNVIFTGYVPQAMLPDLYRGATLFVYPSLYEGFGLPVLEAMASGVAVVTSRASSLPEVVGDTGILVDPRDAPELGRAILELLHHENLRSEMAARGLERAKQFSWDKCAQETLSFYRKALGKENNSAPL
jgi:glycosyltransferase involved in cell wall biosynthesis